jgi:adenosine deaminase
MNSLSRDLHSLPKAHLHLHLVGSMRPATLSDLAQRAGVTLPAPLGMAGSRGTLGWARFDALYNVAKDLLRRPADLVRLVHELAEDEVAAGSGWVEVQANPSLYHGRFGPEQGVLELLLEAGRQATAATGVGIGWVVAADRRFPERALGLARLAVRYASAGVVGFGLANDETAQPAAAFTPAFAAARDGGLLSVPHAGELCGAPEVADAVRLLGAHRIGHGVRAAEDPALLAELAEAGTHLEVCPASNLALGVTPQAAAHPLPALLAAGCSVSLGADDPLLFRAGLVDQYELARKELGLGDTDLAGLARAGVLASAAPAACKAELLAGIRAWLAAAPARAA